MQQGTTSDMIFGVAFLVSDVSQFMRLMPGDVITTGTPSGIGHARRPPVYLQPGDRLDLSIQGLGQQGNRVVAG
jgi:2-keto-4-pentenoate hydratase/2-oxohepta-3-ene-1,7-dioic acid hydratase in catechol pathway